MGIATWVVIAIGVAAVGASVAHLVVRTQTTLALALTSVALAFVGGLMGTVIGLRHAYAAVAGADPSRKATMLAEGISQAMNCTAFGLAAVILWIPPFVIAEVRRRRPPPPRPGLRLEP